MEAPKPDGEAIAFLEMAQKVRSGLTHRDEVVGPFLDRYDRSQDDPRVVPEKRVQIAVMFLRATYKADHVYEDYLHRARQVYRKSMNGHEASD